jgi:hypothetical protein
MSTYGSFMRDGERCLQQILDRRRSARRVGRADGEKGTAHFGVTKAHSDEGALREIDDGVGRLGRRRRHGQRFLIGEVERRARLSLPKVDAPLDVLLAEARLGVKTVMPGVPHAKVGCVVRPSARPRDDGVQFESR